MEKHKPTDKLLVKPSWTLKIGASQLSITKDNPFNPGRLFGAAEKGKRKKALKGWR